MENEELYSYIENGQKYLQCKVFHKGKEQPELKGTLKPTKVKPVKKRVKLTKDEKMFKRAEEYKKKLKAKRKNKK